MPKQTITIQSIDDLREGDVFGGFVIKKLPCGYAMGHRDDASDLYQDSIVALISNGFNTVQREVERYTVRDEGEFDEHWFVFDNAAGGRICRCGSQSNAQKIATALNKQSEEA
jgi:hypothetical protein